jgi:hypothetical protein
LRNVLYEPVNRETGAAKVTERLLEGMTEFDGIVRVEPR